MKVLIDISEKTYTEIKIRGSYLNPKDEHALIQSFRNGRVLDKIEVKKIDEILNPHNIYKNGCCSCPHSGSIIDGYRDCPDAYTEQAQHCGFYNKGK